MNDFDNKQICSYKDIDRFGFTCDVCGRKVNGCHYINGMSFCEKCYQETFGKDNQQNEIQQIKQQLVEKDKEIESIKQQLEETNAGYDFTYEQSSQAIKELKQNQIQLAIQELEKVKILLQNAVNYDGYTFVGIYNAVNNQIKELKG